LSGSGKTTLARALEQRLLTFKRRAVVLDGDRLRQGLNSDLGFSAADRAENIRRAAEVARLFAEAGSVAIAAFISPYRASRAKARAIIGRNRFLEVYLNAPIAVCEQRDPKGLYRRARAGAIANFTGVDAPFEPPPAPDLVLDTAALDIAACLRNIVELLERKGWLRRGIRRKARRSGGAA
jgi:adenylyl-sulfate kinase